MWSDHFIVQALELVVDEGGDHSLLLLKGQACGNVLEGASYSYLIIILRVFAVDSNVFHISYSISFRNGPVTESGSAASCSGVP